MRVRLISKSTIEEFSRHNPQSRTSFGLWLTELRVADWNSPEDIKDSFASADLLGTGSDRVVFDIGGNKYRMICHYFFGERQVHRFICWIGTHAEYSKLCKNKKQYTVSAY